MSGKKSSDFNFEAALTELNTIVEQMEQGSLTLEASLKAFEKGVALTRQCQNALTMAEQKVKILLEKNGKTDLYTQIPEEDE